MIRKIIRFSATNRLLVLALTAVALTLALWSMRRIPLDALPDLSDTQVIVYSKWDRSPDIVEDQLTYPIVTSLLGAPKVKAVRGFSDYGTSFVYVIFEDGTDLYWARSRVLEYMSKIQSRLPAGVETALGPDATSVGWVYQYALVDPTGRHTSDELRSAQDWFLRYGLQSVPGVAEVASVGGQVKEYQVAVDLNALASYGIPLQSVVEAVRRNNDESGGRLVEMSGREYMVRGLGYVKSTDDLASLVLKAKNGTPVRLGQVSRVSLGPGLRRGVADLDGQGDAVGGIVVMRQGENALAVIQRVKAKLHELEPGLPVGVKVVTTYDRSELIQQAVGTVKDKLIEEIVVVSLVILLFLWHAPSASVPIATLPVSVALSFIPLLLLGVGANLLSMAGIAISIGVLVDGAIVEVENAYNKLHIWDSGGRQGDFHAVRLEALEEVGPSVFFSLLLIAAAFLPVFTLVDQEGRLFRPLAWSNTLALAIAALLALTLNPAMRMLFVRMDSFTFKPRWLSKVASALLVGKYRAEERHPISRSLHRFYEPPCRFVLRHAKAAVGVSLLLVALSLPLYFKLGSEFMPPLNEGSILYMPTTFPGLSAEQAEKALQLQDKLLMQFPEVARVYGKAGRADTPTDPAPLSMVETVVLLKPKADWPERPRWYSSWAPQWMKHLLGTAWPDRESSEQLIQRMDGALQIPGFTNAWTMPIKNRLDMLSTGIRTPVGLKLSGPDLKEVQRLAVEAEGLLQKLPDTRSAFAERVAGGWYLDFAPKREALARYGLSIGDLNAMVLSGIGGEAQSYTVEGRARYPITVRFAASQRQDPATLSRVLVSLPGGGQVPISELADLKVESGPSMIRDENGLLTAYVFVDFDTSKVDVGSFVDRGKIALQKGMNLPQGYTLEWSGQYENMLRVQARLKLVVPLALLLIFGLLFLNTKSAFKAGLVMLAVPFSAIGALWLLWILGYHASAAVWVGLIALMGLDAETGVFMLLFLDLAHDQARREGRLNSLTDLREAIIHGAVKRVRPKAMTVCAAFLGLLPIMWSSGTGADLMKRIAAPMVGGLATSFILELLVYPAVYYLWKQKEIEQAPKDLSHELTPPLH